MKKAPPAGASGAVKLLRARPRRGTRGGGRSPVKEATSPRAALSQVKSISRIARDLGVGSSTVRRVLIERPVA